MGDAFELDPVSPTREGPLTITIRCSTIGRGGAGATHPVTINSDWSVTVPHDLELERIARGMGGYLTCLDFADHALPAFRELVQLSARRVAPKFTRDRMGRWQLPCDCTPNGHSAAVFAADHSRDVVHVARTHDVSRILLGRLMADATKSWGCEFSRPPNRGHNLVREFDGIERLWSAGVHPDLVERLHRALWRDDAPMPLRFYLGAVVRRPDLDWLAKTIDHVPDEDVAVWLCWTETELDRRNPDARIAWLRAGVPRPAIVGLLDGDYTPADVAHLVARSRRSVPRAALTLAAWAHAHCHPSIDEIVELDELDVDPFFSPSPAAVDWLQSRASPAIPRTQIGLILALVGNRRSALQLLDHGLHDLSSAAAHIRLGVTAQ